MEDGTTTILIIKYLVQMQLVKHCLIHMMNIYVKVDEVLGWAREMI